MNTSQPLSNASVEEWCRSLEEFSADTVSQLNFNIIPTDVEEHQMDDVLVNEEEGTRPPANAKLPALEKHTSNLAVLLRDDTNWLSTLRSLQDTDVILLLAPLVNPVELGPGRRRDPFEVLGRALAQEDLSKTPPVARNKVRHAPYRREQGITSQHLSFIKHSNYIILCYVTESDEEIPLNIADITFAVLEQRPCVIVVCCNPIKPQQYIPFPTVVQAAGYSAEALQATAELIFGKNTQPLTVGSYLPAQIPPQVWQVDDYSEARDISETYQLWKECVETKFALDQNTFARLLDRPGYAKHYIVRDTQTGHILGFCATFFHFVDREGEKLVASVACLLTQPRHRRRGIGVSLHTHAVAQLKRIRGVVRLQLGSTYPRLLYGPPFETTPDEFSTWIRRRGWQMADHPVRDLILHCRDWPAAASRTASSVTFRSCRAEEMVEVIALVDRTATRLGRTGWFDQYASLMDTPNIRDVVIGVENSTILAAGLTFTPGCGSQIESNVPWPAQIGVDVGGLTCVCVHEKSSESVTVGLLDACIRKLQSQGMTRVFMDRIMDGYEELSSLGFKEWSRYREVWRDA